MRRRLPPARSLCLLLALCVTVVARSAASSAASTSPSSHQSPPSSWAAQCAACRNFVECDLAYHGRAGKFCFDNPASGAACCCPLSARCIWYRFDAQCYCDEMILGRYTPLAVGLCGIAFLFVTIYKCLCPPSDAHEADTSRRPVTERSRLLHANGSGYGSARVSDASTVAIARDGD